MITLYFSATGNGIQIAKSIGGELISIPKTIKEDRFNFTDDAIGLVFPVYGWGVPVYIEEFINKAFFNTKYLFAVMSCGMMPGAASWHLTQIGSKRKLEFSYINTIVMADNYLPMFDMAKQEKELPKKQVDFNLNNIMQDINNRKKYIPKHNFIVKAMSQKLSRRAEFSNGIGISKKYSIDDTCTSCGVCEKVCPVSNIKLVNGKPKIGQSCIVCLACVQNCPTKSIRLKDEKSNARYRNSSITLNEIIEANN